MILMNPKMKIWLTDPPTSRVLCYVGLSGNLLSTCVKGTLKPKPPQIAHHSTTTLKLGMSNHPKSAECEQM